MNLRSFKITVLVLLAVSTLIAFAAAVNTGEALWLNLIAVLVGAAIIGALTLGLGRDGYR